MMRKPFFLAAFILQLASLQLFAQDATFTYQIDRVKVYSVIFQSSNYVMDDTLSYSFSWDFGDGNTGSYPFVMHTYQEPGTYTVRLNVTDSNTSLTDSYFLSVTISDFFNVPNVFTPDGDGINDLFIAQSDGVTPVTITIFNRAGSIVYKRSAPTIVWDGKTPSGQRVSPGVYYYVITSEKESYKQTGFFHLFYDKKSR